MKNGVGGDIQRKIRPGCAWAREASVTGPPTTVCNVSSRLIALTTASVAVAVSQSVQTLHTLRYTVELQRKQLEKVEAERECGCPGQHHRSQSVGRGGSVREHRWDHVRALARRILRCCNRGVAIATGGVV